MRTRYKNPWHSVDTVFSASGCHRTSFEVEAFCGCQLKPRKNLANGVERSRIRSWGRFSRSGGSASGLPWWLSQWQSLRGITGIVSGQDTKVIPPVGGLIRSTLDRWNLNTLCRSRLSGRWGLRLFVIWAAPWHQGTSCIKIPWNTVKRRRRLFLRAWGLMQCQLCLFSSVYFGEPAWVMMKCLRFLPSWRISRRKTWSFLRPN